MTAFRRLSRLPTFRDSFESLLALDDIELSTVHEAVRTSGDDPDADELVRDDLVPAYSALAVLRQIAADDGIDALLDDIRIAYRGRGADIDRLSPLMSPTPAERDFQEIREAEQSTLPFVVDGKISLDYRVVESSDGTLRLVPLFLLRLVFDEPIGGASAIAFQVDPEGVDRIKLAADHALSLIPKSAKLIDREGLHEQTITKYWTE